MPGNTDKREPRIEPKINKKTEKEKFIMGLTRGEFNEWWDLRQELIPASEEGRDKMKRLMELEIKRIKATGTGEVIESEEELKQARREAESAFEEREEKE